MMKLVIFEDDVENSENVVRQGETSSDDDNILYSLVDRSTCDEDDSDDTDDSEDSISEESELSKGVMKCARIDFDAVGVVPVQPFLLSDCPLQFFSRFFDSEVYDLLVAQTNLYAMQNSIHFWKDVDVDEMKAFPWDCTGYHTLNCSGVQTLYLESKQLPTSWLSNDSRK